MAQQKIQDMPLNTPRLYHLAGIAVPWATPKPGNSPVALATSPADPRPPPLLPCSWRRDLLTGVVELDERLVVRRGDVTTGLIVGLPASALPRTPLYR